MKLQNTRLHILEEEKDLSKEVKTGVSLHCHTQFSKEMLDFLPFYADKLPVVNYFWKKECDKWQVKTGNDMRKAFDTAFWSPPMSETDVYSIEKKQIEGLGLKAVISISDHDNIEANLKINEHTPNEVAPISLEWTVPFEFGFFHVGVHNLPKDNALELSKTLLDYTFGENPTNERLHELFAMLSEMPEVLVILNHPWWDIEMVGKEKHEILLKNFLKEFAKWIHAFEINGFRTWSENKATIDLAESIGMPLCSGGDRHGCKPNTVLNLTNAKTFAEFVDEVRVDKRTEVVLMPEYAAPLHSRQMQSFSEILSYYEDHPEERRRWFDRIFFDLDGKGSRPLSGLGWRRGGPVWLRWAIKTMSFLGNPKLRPFYQVLMKRVDKVPKTIENAPKVVASEPIIAENENLIADN
jgi:hypothetical protein